ncbi:MAG: hypothetical protein C0467_20505 [Planctomycetaceae bacterium]|nr:hypothetical protein [Planctomycetaceae bacterium]
MHTLVWASRALLVTIPFALAGCSTEKYAPVTGVVTLRGTPLAGATVVFTPEPAAEGVRAATATTASDGTFRLQTNHPGGVTQAGAALGTYKVTVSKFVPPSGMSEEEYAKKIEAEQAANKPYSPESTVPAKVELIPKEYSDLKLTKVEATVKSGSNELKIAIP